MRAGVTYVTNKKSSQHKTSSYKRTWLPQAKHFRKGFRNLCAQHANTSLRRLESTNSKSFMQPWLGVVDTPNILRLKPFPYTQRSLTSPDRLLMYRVNLKATLEVLLKFPPAPQISARGKKYLASDYNNYPMKVRGHMIQVARKIIATTEENSMVCKSTAPI